MRRTLGLIAVLLLCLPGMSEAQSCDGCGISYKAPGGLSSLTSSGTAITSTVPFLLPNGTAAAPSLAFTDEPATGFYRISAGTGPVCVTDTNVNGIMCWRQGPYITMGSTVPFGWTSSSDPNGVIDTTLFRDAANTLALRNSTNAQTFNVYNTYTDASNYEGATFSFAGAGGANVLSIGTTKAGSGSNRNVLFQVAGSAQWYIAVNSMYPNLNATMDLGSSIRQVKQVYVAQSLQGSVTKALTAGAATTVATVAVPQTAGSNFAAGEVKYTVYATDTTDTQTLNGVALFSAINKAGTETCTIEDNQITDEASSSGTLACTIACATGLTDVVGITLDCASSLTETTLNALVRFDMQQPNTLTFP